MGGGLGSRRLGTGVRARRSEASTAADSGCIGGGGGCWCGGGCTPSKHASNRAAARTSARAGGQRSAAGSRPRARPGVVDATRRQCKLQHFWSGSGAAARHVPLTVNDLDPTYDLLLL